MNAVHAEWKTREVRPITAAECYEMAAKSWVAAAAQDAFVRAARTIEALEMNARRYQWLRDVGDETWMPFAKRGFPNMTDAAIDAAMVKVRA